MGSLADDPFGGRAPTSHERMAGQPWDASYHEGPAPWDIGRPQPAVVRMASAGGFTGTVLDAGCGTGENALHLASLGLPVLGFDVAETALALARAKAASRGIEAEFVAADAFRLERLRRTFDTVLDCGLFHTFDADERPAYVASLASATEHAGTLYVLCFSDEGLGHRPAPGQPGRSGGGVHPECRVDRRGHRRRPGAHPLPRRRRAGLARHDPAHLSPPRPAGGRVARTGRGRNVRNQTCGIRPLRRWPAATA